MQTINDLIKTELFNMQDKAYRDFNSRLVPNLSKDVIVGVRTPLLRKYAKGLTAREDIGEFLYNLPHEFFEENNIHGFIIESIKDFDTCIAYVENFLPFIDNWATCDMIRPSCFKKNTDKLYSYVKKWIRDDKTYTIRYAVGLLNSYYLDDKFDECQLELVSSVESDEYYVNMMIAWYFATALTKQYESTVKIIEGRVLTKWTHNKAIQKAVESLRISDEKKQYLKTLKV